MGRATRWLKGLFGLKRKCVGNPSERESSSTATETGLVQNPVTIPPNLSPAEAAWLRSFFDESDKEQSKYAIAVAAATAAAADAAVAAANAAVAVVRLTSQGRGTMFAGGRERWAAVRIQSVFRGYLARKALRALKGLVKLQAHVRGYLVRRQATATLHGMQALLRAQARVISHRGHDNNNLLINNNNNEIGARKSTEKFDESRSEHSVSVHGSRRVSGSLDATISSNSVEESPKIVEVDTFSGICRPKSRSRRTNNVSSVSDFADELPYQAFPTPYPSRIPPRLSIREQQGSGLESEWGLTGDECRFSTAHSTPRFASFCGADSSGGPAAKSLCGDSCLRQYVNSPGYMASTQSFKAKLRSLSAPKQRPEPKKRVSLSLNEMMVESRNSLSGVKMQRSCSQVQQAVNFRNAVMGKLDRYCASDREEETERRRRWGLD